MKKPQENATVVHLSPTIANGKEKQEPIPESLIVHISAIQEEEVERQYTHA
jgi:hypothetical protein